MLAIDITDPDRVTLDRPSAVGDFGRKRLSVGFSARNGHGYECGNVGLHARPDLVAEVGFGWLRAALDEGAECFVYDDPEAVLALGKRLTEAAEAALAERNPVAGLDPRD